MDRNSSNQDFSESDCSQDSSSSNLSSSTDSSNVSQKESTKKEYEATKITTEVINLPKDLCEDPVIFEEFFSLETWHNLSDPIRKHLSSYLPTFSENIEYEKNSTIDALFTNRITRFGHCPLKRLQHNLEEGNCRPEISIFNKSIAKAERREQRFQERSRMSALAQRLVVSREKALRNLYQHPDAGGRAFNRNSSVFHPSINSLRAKRRYLQEISGVSDLLGLSELLSDEERNSELLANHLPRKQRRLFGPVQGGASSPGADHRIINTQASKAEQQIATGHMIGSNGKIQISERHYRDLLFSHKRRKIDEPDHPDLDCQEIKLKDVVSRTQASSGYRRIMPLPKVSLPEESVNISVIAPEQMIEPCIIPSRVTSPAEICAPEQVKIDIPLISSKPEPENIISTNSRSSPDLFHNEETLPLVAQEKNHKLNELPDICIEKPQVSFELQPNLFVDQPLTTEEVVHEPNVEDNYHEKSMIVSTENTSSNNIVPNENENIPSIPMIPTENNEEVLKTERQDTAEVIESVKILEEIVEQKDMELNESNDKEILGETKVQSHDDSMPELMQETHKCFLSLVRDMFCSNPDHRMTTDELKIKLNLWLKTPIAALNDWYQQAEDKWDDLLQSAILFLSGEFSDQPDDFVPYIEYKTQINIYQWIGASRDSDHRLMALCEYWLSRKQDMGVKAQSKPKVISTKQRFTFPSTSSFVDDEDVSSERSISPPPPRHPTDWSVRKATEQEVAVFREQEKRRYENPHLAFTYKQHSYNSVVGPVKGIYTQVPGISKARGHNMLVADRPNFVTILTLVRDATARLPNGEGTRADICELLKSSQYISPTATDQVLQTIVSGALDRMHTEHDPCVKYDTKRKIWIYLHRNRTEEEFERLHHQYQGISKHKKPVYRKSKSKEAVEATTPRKTPTTPIVSSVQTSIESEANLEDVLVNKPAMIESPSVTIPTSTTSCITLPDSSIITGISLPVTTLKPETKPNALHETVNLEPQISSQLLYTNITPKKSVDGVENSIMTILRKTPSESTIGFKEAIPIHVSPSCKIQSIQLKKSPQATHFVTNANKPFVNVDLSPDRVNQTSLKTVAGSPNTVVTKKNILAPKSLIISSTPVSIPTVSNPTATTIPLQVTAAGGQSFITPVTLQAGNTIQHTTFRPAAVRSVNVQQQQQQAPAVSMALKTATLLQGRSVLALTSQSQLASVKAFSQSDIQTIINKPPITTTATITGQLNNPPGTMVLKTDNVNSSSSGEIVSTINTIKGQQSVLTPAQQKQILQNLLAQQHKQVFTSKPVILKQPTNSSTATQITNSPLNTQQSKIVKHLHKIPALTLSAASSFSSSHGGATIQTVSANPHVIQIKSTNNILNTAGGTKIQPIITTIKEQMQQKTVQQSLITKNTKPMLKADTSDMATLKASPLQNDSKTQSVLLQSTSSSPIVTRVIKPAGSVSQSTTSLIRSSLANTVSVGQGTPQVVTKVVKSIGDNQIVSLDSLLQRQRITTGETTAIRLADAKNIKTQLIQLSNNSSTGSSIPQYAVISQNRNIISVAQTSGQSTTQSIVTTIANSVIDTKTTPVLSTSHSAIINSGSITFASGSHADAKESGQLNVVKTTSISNLQKASQNQHSQQVFTKITGTQKVISAKTRNDASFINSPINIATIGGNPLIIHKPAVRADTNQPNSSGIIFHNPASSSSESTSIVYGRQAVKIPGNLISQGHVNIVSAQQATGSGTPQKLLLGNQLVKVRTVPRHPGQMQFTFAQQQPKVESPINTSPAPNTISGIVKSINSDTSDKTTINSVVVKAPVVSNTAKSTSEVDIRVNQQPQRVVLATQGRQLVTQQIIVPPGFQGGAFNIKRLKVIPVNSQQKGSIIRAQPSIIQQSSPSVAVTKSAASITLNDTTNEGGSRVFHVYSSGNSNNSSSINDNVDFSVNPGKK
ncbi:nuclear factor related to kappa-B-binding protein [Uranotaenia lowii]|uniref:nuclear factor related to kappa-B-binding protein n=1 Tax=Uranotaenia lowii TaxID=190385 RepID=UPI00247B2832|nr:nuclear factor related to kappa-B-binding protein [Uranotaenia lowii]